MVNVGDEVEPKSSKMTKMTRGSVGRIIFESLDSVFGLFGFWLISGSQSWIPVDGSAKFVTRTHTFQIAKPKRKEEKGSLSGATGAIFDILGVL